MHVQSDGRSLVRSRVQEPPEPTLCKELAVGKAEVEGGAAISEKRSTGFVWAVTATTNTRLIFAAANLVKPALHQVNARLKK